jgi:hypothetical protein
MFHAKVNAPTTTPQIIAVAHFCFVILFGFSGVGAGM